MRGLVTGGGGHLGEALVRTLRDGPHGAVGVDRPASPWTDRAGSLADRRLVRALVPPAGEPAAWSGRALACLRAGEPARSALARAFGSTGDRRAPPA